MNSKISGWRFPKWGQRTQRHLRGWSSSVIALSAVLTVKERWNKNALGIVHTGVPPNLGESLLWSPGPSPLHCREISPISFILIDLASLGSLLPWQF